MNTTVLAQPPILSWFIPTDILRIICGVLIVVACSLYLLITIFNKICHTVPMMLVANSHIPALVYGCNIIWMCVFSLQNDLEQVYYQDSLCIFRAYIFYVTATNGNFAYTIQALYRYVVAVYPTYLYWQTTQCQLFVIVCTWLFSLIHPFVFMFTNQVVYNVDNQICQIPLKLSFSMFCVTTCAYTIPMFSSMVIYWRLVRYVCAMKKRVSPGNLLARAQRELKMVRRIITLLSILLILGVPYICFGVISCFTSPPIYHFRIAYLFIDVALVAATVTSFLLTDPLKDCVMKRCRRQPNRILPAVT